MLAKRMIPSNVLILLHFRPAWERNFSGLHAESGRRLGMAQRVLRKVVQILR